MIEQLVIDAVCNEIDNNSYTCICYSAQIHYNNRNCSQALNNRVMQLSQNKTSILFFIDRLPHKLVDKHSSEMIFRVHKISLLQLDIVL